MVDLESVTMITPEQFAASESDPVFTFANGMSLMRSISGKLSLADCEALNYMYQCGIRCGSTMPEITMVPATRVVNMHCWTAQQAGQPISAADEAKQIGEIGRIAYPAPASDVRYTFGSSNFRLKVRNDPSATSAAVGLSQTISTGFETTFTVDARVGSKVVATGSIEAWINCWPQFSIRNRLIDCRNDEADDLGPSLGLRDAPRCVSMEDDPTLSVPCSSELIFLSNTEAFRVAVFDPDGFGNTESEMIEVVKGETEEDETSAWIYDNVTRSVRRLGPLEDLENTPPRIFRILFRDTTYSNNVNPDGYIILEYFVNLKCEEPT
ncbi:uncharacterized protein LOC129597240 [Paramacrobiotus metropolitanus]|uniref:uncharacterized protein LOC129597240 n=1 Tax=Paramacrobiotus metropolitanus TaxID=2943436 RepID=UPI0024464037|nr:uncharacterized protein LOC129597240 [Paramacrobiotus metropolitanus]